MTGKEPLDNCEDYTKPFYFLHQAAYSWCGLTEEDYEYFRQLELNHSGEIGGPWGVGGEQMMATLIYRVYLALKKD